MEVKVMWMRFSSDDGNGNVKMVVAEDTDSATHALLSKADLMVVMNVKRKIGDGFNTSCPDCGFTVDGLDSAEDAALWTCPECQPSLPGLEHV